VNGKGWMRSVTRIAGSSCDSTVLSRICHQSFTGKNSHIIRSIVSAVSPAWPHFLANSI
jgi:hypothetical protein